MFWEEIERRIAAGGDADELWECLYLTAAEVAELLTFVKAKTAPVWVYPMITMAAHTGARRSELIRCHAEDIDLKNLIVTIVTVREKNRSKGTRTTRRVPISKLLAEVLAVQMARQKGKTYLFGEGEKSLSVQATHSALWRARKRYRHIFPQVTNAAITKVFG